MSITYMDKRGFVNQSNEHAAYILRQYKKVQSIQIVVDENSSMNIMSFPISRLHIIYYEIYWHSSFTLSQKNMQLQCLLYMLSPLKYV